jgi:alpha-L-fucosidase
VGRGANLLLNVPPDRRGMINEKDSAALIGFKKLRDESFRNNLAKLGSGYFIPHNGSRPAPNLNDGKKETFEYTGIYVSSIGIELKEPRKINCIVLNEYLNNGQHCRNFQLLLMNKKHELIKEIHGTTIGRERIVTFSTVEISIIGLYAPNNYAGAWTAISEIAAYLINQNLIEK